MQGVEETPLPFFFLKWKAGAKYDLLSSSKIRINLVLGIYLLISTKDILVIVEEIVRTRFLIGHE